MLSFDRLVDEAAAAPIVGWDFSWLEGRATEERPTWRYAERVAQAVRSASAALDVQTGGGELVASLPALPSLMVTTEGHAPNLRVAGDRLRPRGAFVVGACSDRPELPFASACFDLVTSRHPVTTWWSEIARVLVDDGLFMSQQVGPHSVGELTEFFLGPQPEASNRDPELARSRATAAGLVVEDLRVERLRTVFYDIGAVVYFLRLVIWIVPGFTVDRFRSELAARHEQIDQDGAFVAHASRFYIEARKPAHGCEADR